nr:ferritin-like domain-containing protein [Candidatus Microthrix sp.]
MKGSPQIIEFLNEALTAELTAINQYFAHAKLCESWGWHRLAASIARSRSRRCATPRS